MGKIAIVEDTQEEKKNLTACLEKYKVQMHENISWVCFENAYDFTCKGTAYICFFII